MALIDVNDVYYSYDEASGSQALSGVSLSVERGEFLSVLGHNGSGKSTLAKLMNALYVPASGSVVVCGRDTRDQSATFDVRKRVGMVFQNPDNQMVATIVEEDVAFGLENLGIPPPDIRLRVDEALNTVRMGKFAASAPHMLSGGQKQRIAIAGVLAMRPEVIVLDEPTAMLDPSGRREVIDTVEHINRSLGVTIILITHFMDEAARAGRVIVMEEGKILMQGTPREVFSRVEELKAARLDVPPPTELASRLKRQGIDIMPDILTEEELVSQLCRLL